MEKTATTLEELLQEQEKAYEPFQDRIRAAGARAAESWSRSAISSAESQLKVTAEASAFATASMRPLLKLFADDRDYLTGLQQFKNGFRDLPTLAGPESGMDLQSLMFFPFPSWLIQLLGGNFEESFDVFAKPYAGQGAEKSGTTLRHFDGTGGNLHQQHQAVANRTNGTMSFVHLIGQEGGTSSVAVALWMHFMRRSPGVPPGQGNPGLAQVRPVLSYSDQWTTESYIAPAHNRAGFGIFVRSEDLNGGDQRTDQDFRYNYFTDSTSWYDSHHNPAWPASDEGVALDSSRRAPWFIIHPGRIYSVAVWSFASCDAHGADLIQASYAGAGMSARMPFCVVAQSKN